MRRKRVVLVLANTAYGRGVMQGVVRYASAHDGWDILYKGNALDPQVLFKAAAAADMWADGVIGHFINEGFLKEIQRRGVPAVNVSSWFQTANPPRVHSDEFAVGKLAAEYFMERGLRHFAYWGSAYGAYAQLRCQGFEQTLRAHGFTCEVFDSTVAEGLTRRAWMNAEEKLGQRLASMQRPIGVLCVNDMLARELLWVSERLGVRCPDDIAVLGIENDELACSVAMPPLSSIELAAVRIGQNAADLLDKMMAGQPAPEQPILVPSLGVITRQSTDIIAVTNPEIRDAIRFIRNNAHKPIDVRDILRTVPVSRRSLEMQFKKLLHRTPRQQIQFERVQIVKKLLLETDLSIAQIAKQAGFSSAALAWVIFRRFTGMGPKEYRQRYL